MKKVFLTGGGGEKTGETFGRFAGAAYADDRRMIALILVEEPDVDLSDMLSRYREKFTENGVEDNELQVIWVSPDNPVSVKKLEEISPTAVFVGGGTTPLYHASLCGDRGFADYLKSVDIPYGGFSAGAAIAAEKAVLGGWKMLLKGKEISILDEECSEDVDMLMVRPGLGLVPFSVDVHASQWGNLTRLVHAVDQQMVESGWAIDEDTVLQVEGRSIQVHGEGQVYRVERAGDGRIHLNILRSGDDFGSRQG